MTFMVVSYGVSIYSYFTDSEMEDQRKQAFCLELQAHSL